MKVFKGFRFDPEVYEGFKQLSSAKGCTVTYALERFMYGCVANGILTYPSLRAQDYEAEAEVLVDWLRKGKRFYRTEKGEEASITGRLIWLLPTLQDSKLKELAIVQLQRAVAEKT